MIKDIDIKIKILLHYRDSELVMKHSDLRAWICNTIAHCYSLQFCLLTNQKINSLSNQFFTAKAAVNRHYRDWGLAEVADIYNELCVIAEPYI